MGETEDVWINADSLVVHFIIEQQGGAFDAGELLFEIEKLAAVAQGRFSHEAELGKGIENDSGRFNPAHFVVEQAGDFIELDFSGMKNSGLRFRPQKGRDGGEV